jgi:hypothetical protein
MGHPDLIVDHVGQRAAGDGPPKDVRGGKSRTPVTGWRKSSRGEPLQPLLEFFSEA